MRRRLTIVGVIALAAIATLALGMIFWSRSGSSPPSVSVDLLGYTNRIGPHAVLAITNRSKAAITLDTTCLVKYSKIGADKRITSLEPNRFRVTQLAPNEGFVQEFFVFPATQGQWQFECYATYSSALLQARRAADLWLAKHARWTRKRIRFTTWQQTATEWRECPP